MKKYIFLILLIIPVALFAQENKAKSDSTQNNVTIAQANNIQLWEKANAFYTTEEYQKAIGIYQQILNSGVESAKLYFNLANAYYKAGDMNNAILYYERAKLLAPNDEDIAFNLKLANQYVVTSIDELPKPFFMRWKKSVMDLYPAETWSYISITAFILFLLLLGLFIFSRTVAIRRIAFWVGILAVIFSGFTFSFAAYQKKITEIRDHAIVFCPRVTVKSSPAESGTDLFLIYEGLKVQITDSLSTWKEIKLADGNEGWLPDSCIVRI